MAKRGYVSIEGVRDPNQPSGRTTAYLPVSDFNATAKFSPFKAELMRVAQDVLRAPGAIFEAERNVGRHEIVGFCFTGCPDTIPNGRGGTMALPPGRVVVVYVDKELNVWEWGLERSGDDPLRPNEPESRFGERLL